MESQEDIVKPLYVLLTADRYDEVRIAGSFAKCEEHGLCMTHADEAQGLLARSRGDQLRDERREFEDQGFRPTMKRASRDG
jgi:hypothetical protein